MKVQINLDCSDEDYNQAMLTMDTISAVISSRYDMLILVESLRSEINELKGRKPTLSKERAETCAQEVESWARDQFGKLKIKVTPIFAPK